MFISLKENEYGSNHFFNVLGIAPLQDLVELRKTLEMLIWDYNGKFYLKINDVKIRELPNEHVLKKDVPYIMDLTFSKYDCQKGGEQITGYRISEINEIYEIIIIIIYLYIYIYIYIYIERNGIIRISFKTFWFFITL